MAYNKTKSEKKDELSGQVTISDDDGAGHGAGAAEHLFQRCGRGCLRRLSMLHTRSAAWTFLSLAQKSVLIADSDCTAAALFTRLCRVPLLFRAAAAVLC